jgi:hypothetical protein
MARAEGGSGKVEPPEQSIRYRGFVIAIHRR